METLPASSQPTEEQIAPVPETVIQDSELAYDVAHDSVVQGRQQAAEEAANQAAYWAERGGNPQAAEQHVADARAAVDKAIEDATPLYTKR